MGFIFQRRIYISMSNMPAQSNGLNQNASRNGGRDGKQLVIEIATRSLMSLLLSTLSTPDSVVYLRDNRLAPSGAPARNSVGLSFTRVVFCSHLNACIFHDTGIGDTSCSQLHLIKQLLQSRGAQPFCLHA